MNIKFKSDNMDKTYIFGHKSPDTDTITSSLVMCELEKQLGNKNAVACRLGNINKETIMEWFSWNRNWFNFCNIYSICSDYS